MHSAFSRMLVFALAVSTTACPIFSQEPGWRDGRPGEWLCIPLMLSKDRSLTIPVTATAAPNSHARAVFNRASYFEFIASPLREGYASTRKGIAVREHLHRQFIGSTKSR